MEKKPEEKKENGNEKPKGKEEAEAKEEGGAEMKDEAPEKKGGWMSRKKKGQGGRTLLQRKEAEKARQREAEVNGWDCATSNLIQHLAIPNNNIQLDRRWYVNFVCA